MSEKIGKFNDIAKTSASTSESKIIEDPSNESGEIAQIDLAVLQSEMKIETLKTLLKTLIITINQHTIKLNSVNNENKKEFFLQHVSDTFDKLCQAITFSEPELMKILNNQFKKFTSGSEESSINELLNKLCNKLCGYGQAIAHVYQKNRQHENRIITIDSELNKKVPREEFKNKVEKSKTKGDKKLKELKESIEIQFSEIEAKFYEKIEKIEAKICDVEKNTLWKIKDCEELLKIRVNKEYIKECIKSLEEKFSIQMAKTNEINTNNFNKIYHDNNEMSNKLKILEQSFNDISDAQKKKINDIETELIKRVSTDQYIEYKLSNNASINTIKDMLKKYELSFSHINSQHLSMEKTISEITAKLDILNQNLEYNKEHSQLSEADLAKFAEYEKQITKLTDDIEKYNQLTINIQEDLSKKIHLQLNDLSAAMAEKLDKQDVINIINELNPEGENAKQLTSKEVRDVYKRIEQYQDHFEKKFKKLGKETDFTVLLRQIKGKAEDEEVKKGFINVDGKLTALSDLINAIKRETEISSNTIKTIKAQLKSNENPIAKTKQIAHPSCLSCGKGDLPQVTPINNAKGSDGKIYRTDKLNSSGIDSQEDYDAGLDIFNDSRFFGQIPKDDIKNISIFPEAFHQKLSRGNTRLPSPMKITTPDRSFNIMSATAYNSNITPLIRQGFRPSSAMNS